jgi:hypothetical protein
MERDMRKRRETNLSELMFDKVQDMSTKELAAFREVLKSTLPAYIDEAAKRAVEQAQQTESQKHDNKA